MSVEVFDLLELPRQTSGFAIHYCLGTDGPSNFEQGFCSKVPLSVKGGELELPNEKEIKTMTAVKMLESNERSDCKAAGFGKHVVGIALTQMFPVIPIRAELCWRYLTGVFELMARSRTRDIGAEIAWSQSLCLKPHPQPRCRRSTKPCEQISTSSIIRVCLKKGLGLRACGSLYTKFWYVWATHPHLTTKSIGLFLSV